GSYPTVGARIVSPARVQRTDRKVVPAPDDHFVAGPHRRVTGSAQRRVADGRGRPAVRARTVSAAGVQRVCLVAVLFTPTPHNHFAPGPYCSMTSAYVWRIHNGSRIPGIVTAATRRPGYGG